MSYTIQFIFFQLTLRIILFQTQTLTVDTKDGKIKLQYYFINVVKICLAIEIMVTPRTVRQTTTRVDVCIATANNDA